MKKILVICLMFILIISSISVFAASSQYSDNVYCVSTPDDEPVPYPPEISSSEENYFDNEINNASLEEAEKSKIWEEYGFTKEEFDNFPDALRNAMLFEPEEIGKSFGVPTREDLARWEEKENEINAANNEDFSTQSTTNEVRNAVGEFIQTKPYTCGPASARNAINGYLWAHYTSNGLAIPMEPWWGDVPTEDRLGDSDNLNTNTSGTAFDSRWESVMNWFVPGNNYTLKWGTNSNWENTFWSNVKSTLNKSGNYNVIVDLYGTITSANQINYEYPIGSSYAHYICVFGYDPDDSTVFVEDSHNTHSLHMYRVSYSKVAKACQARGIVW